MDKRPYFSKTVDELTELFESSKDKPRILKALLKELGYRSRPKAKRLAKQIEDYLANQEKPQPVQATLPIPEQPKPPEQATLPLKETPDGDRQEHETPAAPQRKKWPWKLWLAALVIACCGYVYWQYGNDDPDIFQEINGQEDVDKQITHIKKTMEIIRQ